MKKSRIIVSMLLLLCFTTMFGSKKYVFGASASITMVVEQEKIVEGDTFSVLITVSSSTAMGSFDTYFTYDNEMFEFVTNNHLMKEENGVIWVFDRTFDEGVVSRKYVLEFKALKVGNTQIEMKGIPVIYSFSNQTALSVATNKVEIEVEEKERKSENAKLSQLSIAEGKFLTPFSPDSDLYEVKIPEDISEVTVSATPEDEKAKVNIEGASDLKMGQNKVTVTVTAQSKHKMVYTLYVTREKEVVPTIEPTVEPTTTPQVNSKEEMEDTLQQTELKDTDKELAAKEIEYRIEKKRMAETIQRLELLIALLIALILMLVIIVVRLVMKRKGFQNDLD